MAQWFFDCYVTIAGVSANQNQTVVGLTDRGGAFQDRQFIGADAVRRELLTVALTALTSGNRVQANVDDGAPEYSTVYALYMVR